MELKELVCPDSFNTRHIPRAPFFESAEKFVAECGGTSQAILSLEDRLAQYNLMFKSLQSQMEQLKGSIPSLTKSLESLDYVEKIPDGETPLFYHEIVNGLYAKAKITDNKKVGLFLGSNIMVEYTVEEAKALIQNNLQKIND